MHILILNRDLEFGGAQRQFVEIARGFQRSGHTVVFASFYDGPFRLNLERDGIEVHLFGKSGRWDVFGFMLRYFLFLKKVRPDVTYAYQGLPAVLASLGKILFRGKVITGVGATNMDGYPWDRVQRVAHWLELRLANKPDLYISNSQAGADDGIRHGFPARKMKVIPNGFDTDVFAPDEAARTRVRAEFGIDRQQLLIGHVGRLDPMKDHPNFFRAAALIAAAEPRVRFVCIGAGPDEYTNSLKELAESLGLSDTLSWMGTRHDMRDVYNAFDALVLSSAYGEGLPNVVGEAMSCGVPCAVTNVGDSAWVVGTLGEVAPPSDSVALSNAIERLIQRIDSGHLTRGQVRGRIVETLSLERYFTHMEQALASLAQ